MEPTVFIAGPIFSEGEREYNLKINMICQSLGFRTFMAQRDVGLVANTTLETAFAIDVENLQKADIIVANLDGIDVDSGTAWEIGYAFQIKKPIIGIRSDARMYRKFLPVNLMIYQSCAQITTLSKLKRALSNIMSTNINKACK